MFVVAGATGHTGSVVAKTLLERGQPVTVLIRTGEQAEAWRARGAKTVVASLEDRGALAEVLQGAAGAYVLLPPHYQAADYLEDRRRVTESLAEAVRASAVRHVVFLSSLGAHRDSGTGVIRVLHEAEHRLREVAQDFTIVRAAYFMENWLPVLPAARAEGVLRSFLTPNRAIPMVATWDIGRIAAECLLDRPKGHRILELSGPTEYSPADVAEAAARLFHRAVTVEHLPMEAAVPAFVALGCSHNVASLFQDMLEGIEAGRVGFQGDGPCRPRGLVTLEQALSDMTPVESNV